MTRTEHETETLIRESLDRLAARAPDGHAVRDALARARRRRRPATRLALVAAAVVALVAGVVAGTQLLTTSDLEPAAGRPVLGYSPGWLPDGFTEQYREGGPGTAPQVRRWFAGPAEITLSAYSTADHTPGAGRVCKTVSSSPRASSCHHGMIERSVPATSRSV